MIDLKWIRENPHLLDLSLQKRRKDPASQSILSLDQKHRHLLTRIQELQSQRNAIAKQIGDAKRQGLDCDDLLQKGSEIREQLPLLEEEEKIIKTALQDLLASLPNILDDSVPEGPDDDYNQLVHSHGDKPSFSFAPKEHYALGSTLMDFETAARLSGSRFVVLKKDLAKLERALASFMIDTHTEKFGYQEISAPYLVKDPAVFGVGQLPKFEEDLFKTTNGFYLISTGEVTLTNLVRDQIIDKDLFPLRFTTYSPCFRSEAGAAGRDTHGMIRVHQFSKVELVSITHPDQSKEEHERMRQCAEEILKLLGLSYRTVLLCGGSVGAASQKTYDLEVWLPGQNQYREISSCSNCGSYQARRMNTRFREASDLLFPHTLNGSGLAVGRTLIALLENYQQEDGSILLPDILHPYMNGQTKIERL